MTLTPGLKVLLIMNNYSHDVATAILLASAVIMWVLERQSQLERAAALVWLRGAYRVLTRFVIGALVWIVAGGIPRTVFFAQLEWDPAVTKFLVPALVVKHVMMFAAVAAGSIMWLRVRKVLAEVPADVG